MYKIGDFSVLGKTTIKTLRYYEKEKLLIPKLIDDNGYRYYETDQLIILAKIISLRQIGLSIANIKEVFNGSNLDIILSKRKQEVENEIVEHQYQLSKINYLLEENNMKYEVTVKNLPECVVYYKEGIIKNLSDIVEFILSSANECREANPNIECLTPDYCYVSYLDGEYKDKDVKVRYAQAVKEKGKETGTIKFEQLKPLMGVSIYHKGSYEGLRDAYGFIMKYIEDNNYEVIDFPRECYIDGMWNKEDPNDWLTEIQVPVKKK